MTHAAGHIRVNYSDHLNVIYKEVAKWCVDHEGSHILYQVESRATPRFTHSILLSWAPNWSIPTTFNAWAACYTSVSSEEGHDSPLFSEFRAWEGDILLLTGAIIGTIVGPWEVDSPSLLGEIGAESYAPNRGIKLIDVSLETKKSGPDEQFSRYIPQGSASSNKTGATPSTNNSGWGLWVADIGDKVIVVPGVSLPLVISPADDSGHWWLLGACRILDSAFEGPIDHLLLEGPGYLPIIYARRLDNIKRKYEMQTFRIQ
jgi:hypothetical protein